ncbi:MAG: DNA alkylation repair protein [bacterium]|nr:DNA alkylation repair protein [bacterium]MCY3953238.1 DNA alkylation repair protein [bacterium]
MSDPGKVLAELEALGTAQNRKVYARHGVGEPMFGVSFAHLRKLGKKLRPDHDLAQALWASGNHDARVLALAVADPSEAAIEEIEAWASEVDNYVLIDEFAAFIAATPHFGACADDWTERTGEWVASAGWSLVAQQALQDDDLPDEYFDARLRAIEAHIGGAANRVRHCMNGALIAIGGRNESLREIATAAARRIGPVVVDHGETSCKTPEAVAYIDRMWARRDKRSA